MVEKKKIKEHTYIIHYLHDYLLLAIHHVVVMEFDLLKVSMESVGGNFNLKPIYKEIIE
jgi:hypothetical protein